MAQPTLVRAHAAAPSRHLTPVPPAPLPRSAPAAARTARPSSPSIHVRTPERPIGTVELRPESESAIVDAATRADVIRLGFSVAVPSLGALARVVALVDEALRDAGRSRTAVRLLLDVEVVVAADSGTARRKRSQLEYLDALAGLSWAPSANRVVTTADRLAEEVRELASAAGVDGVVLLPLGGSAVVDERLRTLVA